MHEKIDNWRSSNKDVINRIDSVEYVSFDIFDTLLKRDVRKPTDVFSIVGIICNEPDFKLNRINAEKVARSKAESKEVTLDDIYRYYDGERRDILEKREIEYEYLLSTVNKDIVEIYDYVVKNKKVVLVSDMYLSKKVIESLLKKNKITGYQRIFISNEVAKTKIEGSLYDYVCKELGIGTENILHIGNAFKADYFVPKMRGIKSIKVGTNVNRMHRTFNNILSADSFKVECMNAFINNHTDGEDTYYKFGYEVFGPLLYGFIDWLFTELRNNQFDQVFFLSRDGYIMKKLYCELEYDKVIPALYFEVSRRSLSVPGFQKNQSFEKIVGGLTVPNMTNITQIFDGLGLDAENYQELIHVHGISFHERMKRDHLVRNEKFKQLFEAVREDVIGNARTERKNLTQYLSQFDFSKKTALVDIGWGGSMQKYLLEMLDFMNISHDIEGFYVGLTLKSRSNLGELGLKAKGYAFDCLNHDNDEELESSYIGLVETMFLEQKGSVKNYEINGLRAAAVRYEYEYMDEHKVMMEAISVDKIQKGALAFSIEFHQSILRKVINSDWAVMYNNMHIVGTVPRKINIKQFGAFSYFNCGDKVYLAKPKNKFYYLLHIKDLKRDLFDSQWKIGFMKALLDINLPYTKIFAILRKEANR